MDFRENWDKSRERFEAFWQGGILDRCCVSILAPRDSRSLEQDPLPDDPQQKIKYWTDGEWVLKRNLDLFENTYYGGDAFPQIFLNLGAAGLAGFFKNARYQFENTVWYFPTFHDWEKDTLEFDPDSFLYKKTLELAKFFVNESKGRFFVSMPDISGAADALAHLHGSENLLMDMVLEKEHVHRALGTIQAVWEKVSEEIYQITGSNNDGGCTIGWLRTWAPGRHAQMQCDLSVMISPDSFDEFIKPELESQTNWMDHSLYHFDGIEQIRHLDSLVSLPRLSVIQWTRVAGQPSMMNYIPVLKKIQAAGKGLLLFVQPDEVETIMEQLSSRKLFLLLSASSEEEARFLLRKVEKLTHE